jgi:hypothetical protein
MAVWRERTASTTPAACSFCKRFSKTWCNGWLWKTGEPAWFQIHAGSNRGVKARENYRRRRLTPRRTGECHHAVYWKKGSRNRKFHSENEHL